MRKLVYVIGLCLLFLACDDGDVIDVELDFDKELSICQLSPENYFVYDIKKKPNESLILIFPRNEVTKLIFTPTENNIQKTFDINGTTSRFNYRTYDGNPENLICKLLPDANTHALKDYAATSGTFTTLTTFDDDPETGKRKITVKFAINNVNLDIISLTEINFGTYTYTIEKQETP